MKKKNLTKVGSSINRYVLSIGIILLLSINGVAQVYRPSVDSTLLNVAFGDGFINNKATLILNGKRIIDSVILNSDPIIGLAYNGFVVHCLKNKTVALFKGGKIDINPLKNRVKLEVVLDSQNFVFLIKRSQGKFITLQRRNNGSVWFWQNKGAPVFD